MSDDKKKYILGKYPSRFSAIAKKLSDIAGKIRSIGIFYK